MKPTNCEPGSIVPVTGVYVCSMCEVWGSFGCTNIALKMAGDTTKRFKAGELFDASCPIHEKATGWTLKEEA